MNGQQAQSPIERMPATRTRSSLRRQARMRTVEQLCSLLRDDAAVRDKWSRYAPEGGHGIHQGALACVLAEYLWGVGAEPRSNTDLPRRLKDTVSRALSGKTLSRRALTLFIAAFDVDETTAKALWVTWEGTDQIFEPYADLDFRRSPSPVPRRSAFASVSG